MRRLRKKLKSNKGASLVVSLLMFLVASFVSVVIVNASLVALKRVNDDKKEAANYYAVNSAARLFTSSLKESKCTITEKQTVYENEDGQKTVEKETPVYTGEGPLGELLADLLQQASGPFHKYNRKVTVSVSDKDGTNPDLDCTITIQLEQDSYRIDADFSNGNSHIFLSAWLPAAPTPKKTVETEIKEGESLKNKKQTRE